MTRPAECPIVGRADELGVVFEALTRGRGVVLSGQPGVGKTRLASEVARRVAERGWSTVSLAAAAEATSIPFAPFLPLIEDDAAGDHLNRFLRAARALVSRGPRAVVVLDDAHLIDDMSVAFVRHLMTATDVRLLLTIRTGALVPSTLVSLWHAGLLRRVEVLALARDETAALMRQHLGGPVDTAGIRWVWETTRGNPLFVTELLLDAVDRGAIVCRDGRWVLDTAVSGAGVRLGEIVAARVGALAPDERAVIDLLSLAEPLGLGLLGELVDIDVIARLEQRGLLDASGDRRRMRIRLAHPLHGEVVRSTMPVTVARVRRRQLVDAFTRVGQRRRDDSLRVAMWRCEIGDVGEWQSLLAAAEELAGASKGLLVTHVTGIGGTAPVPFVDHLERAALLARAAVDGGGSVRAGALLVRILLELGRSDEARTVCDEVERLAADDDELLAVARLRGKIVVFGNGDHEGDGDARDALEVLERFERTARTATQRLAARSSLACLLAFAGDPRAAFELGWPVLGDDRAARSDQLLAAVAVTRSLVHGGRVQEGIELVDRTLATARVDDRMDLHGMLVLTRANLLVLLGRLTEATAMAQACREVAATTGDDGGVGAFDGALADVAFARGDMLGAFALARDAADALRGKDPSGLLRQVLSIGVLAAAHIGDLAGAREAVSELDGHGRRSGLLAADEIRARAWLDIADGRTTTGVARLQAGAEIAAAAGDVRREATLLHDLVRLGHARHAVRRLDKIAADGAGVVGLMARHAAAAVGGRGEALSGVGERWAELGFRLLAAESFAQAASAHARAGEPAESAAAGAQSRSLLASCDRVTTPALSLAGPAATLTRREREVAMLAAKGMSDREIATHLVVSVRTVNAHLYNAYSKLGIDSRADLPSVLVG